MSKRTLFLGLAAAVVVGFVATSSLSTWFSPRYFQRS
jgi:hypothetical protein